MLLFSIACISNQHKYIENIMEDWKFMRVKYEIVKRQWMTWMEVTRRDERKNCLSTVSTQSNEGNPYASNFIPFWIKAFSHFKSTNKTSRLELAKGGYSFRWLLLVLLEL